MRIAVSILMFAVATLFISWIALNAAIALFSLFPA